MSQPLPPRREFRKDSRGISSLIAAIFMVIIILFMSFNVFTFTLFKNTQFRDAVDALNQMDQDSSSERLVASHGNFSVTEPGRVQVRVTISNEGALPADAARMWVVWKYGAAESYGNEELNVSLSPGESVYKSIGVTVPGALPSGTFSGWLVTARGNRVPIERDKVITAQVSEGIGSIKMDFDSFRYYYWHGNNSLTPWDEGMRSFNVPCGEDLVFGILLGNLDGDGREIILRSNSLIQIYAPQSAVSVVAKIVNVEAGEVQTSFTNVTLAYGENQDIFFAIKKSEWKSALSNNPCAVNLLLIGSIGDQDYGQNIPFVSIYVT